MKGRSRAIGPRGRAQQFEQLAAMFDAPAPAPCAPSAHADKDHTALMVLSRAIETLRGPELWNLAYLAQCELIRTARAR